MIERIDERHAYTRVTRGKTRDTLKYTRYTWTHELTRGHTERRVNDPAARLPGSDHAGIATQLVVERALEAEGKTRTGIGREAFTERTWEWKKEYGGRIAGQIRRLGASCDWSRERFTLDEGLSEAVLEAFVSLHDRGLIYKGTYMVNWAPKLQTAVSDLEVEYTDEPGTLFFFKYPVEGGEEDDVHLPVATTRPETILGDTAVAVNPTAGRTHTRIRSTTIMRRNPRENKLCFSLSKLWTTSLRRLA